jgi:flagellar protein FlaG
MNAKEDRMDVFSATSKQVVQPTVDASVESRKVTQSVASNAITQENQTSKDDTKQQLKETVNNLNEQMKSLDTNVTFGFNDKIDSMYVSVIEKDTGKVIRKIPSEEAMKLSEKMKEIVGMIFDKKG